MAPNPFTQNRQKIGNQKSFSRFKEKEIILTSIFTPKFPNRFDIYAW